MSISRKSIAQALLLLLAPTGGPFLTRGRRLVDPNSISGGQFPALFVVKPSEKYHYDGEGDTLPPTRVLDFIVLIYTDFTGNEAAVPADSIDDLLDAIDTALAPAALDHLQNGNRQTLGNLVYNCVIDGEVKLAPGDAIGKGETEIPIRVTLKQYPT